MLKLLQKQRPILKLIKSQQQRGFAKGSFELSYDIPPRYFMVTYHLKGEMADMLKADEYNEHR